jgi:DNA-directed RNA polymerase beta subunit
MTPIATDVSHRNGSTNGSTAASDNNYLNAPGPASIGTGRPIERSTLVKTAQRRAHLHDFQAIEVPNMVEMQLESYQWFLNSGLRELFDSFSPIEDFTGTMSLEFLDYSLGEPKFDPDECRERDLTYEMPMKVKVRVVNK